MNRIGTGKASVARRCCTPHHTLCCSCTTSGLRAPLRCKCYTTEANNCKCYTTEANNACIASTRPHLSSSARMQQLTVTSRPLLLSPMASYWSKACAAQYNRQQLQEAYYGGTIFAVSEACASMCCCQPDRGHHAACSCGAAHACCRLFRLELQRCTAGCGVGVGRRVVGGRVRGGSWDCSVE